MKNPFGTQPWYASTIHKQTIITLRGKKTKKIVNYDGEQDRLYAYYDKRARTVKQIYEDMWEEVEEVVDLSVTDAEY